MQKILIIFFTLICGGEYLNAQSPPAVPVTVSEVTQNKVRKPLNLVGSVEPIRRSLVSAEVSGIVVDYPYSEGDYVEKDQVIARQSVNKLKIILNEAVNTKNESRARLKLAEDELLRINELYEKGIVSKSQLDNAVSEKDALIARQKLLQSRINQFQYDISQTNIKAPFNGYITREYSQIGEWLDSGDDVVELINIDTVQIKVDMWQDWALPFPLYGRLLQAAYLPGRVDSSSAQELQAQLAEQVPNGWLYRKIALHIAERSQDRGLQASLHTQ